MSQSEAEVGKDRDRITRRCKSSFVLFLLAYVTLLTVGLVGMQQFRNWALTTYDTADAQRDWSQWQEQTERQSAGDGPVARRPAKSAEPPALVLARDYYGTLATIFLLLGTVLFATIAILFRGALSSPGRVYDDTDAP